jgi:hypothetical protein
MMSEAMGKILGMAMAYGVSSLGLLLAYVNYRKRIVKADRVMTTTAWAVIAVTVLAIGAGVVVVAQLAEAPPDEDALGEVVVSAPGTAEPQAPPVSEARETERDAERTRWPWIGIVVPAVIFLFATLATAGLHRHFSRPRELLVLLVMLLGGMVPLPAVAQPGPIVTDRPTDSASPLLVPRHAFQLEAGYKFSRIDNDPGTTDVQVLPDLLARFGINKKVEARLVAAGWTFQSGADDKATGFTDISLGTKIHLAEERDRRPQMALLVDLSLPVGHSDYTSDYVIPKVLFLGSNSLSGGLGLTYNVGPSFVTAKSNGETDTSIHLIYAAALSGPVGGPFSLFGELYGAFAFDPDRPSRHSVQAGTTILLNRLFQIDLRGGVGLVANEPDWLFGAGLAFRVPH